MQENLGCDQHGIAITKKAIPRIDGMLIGMHNMLVTAEGAY